MKQVTTMDNLRFDLAGAFLAGIGLMAALAYWLWYNNARPRKADGPDNS